MFYSHYSTITSLIQIFLSISFSLISSTNTKRPLPSSSTKHTGKMLSCHFTGTFLETRKISVKNCSCCSLQEMRNAENAACLSLFHQQDASHCFCWLHKFQATNKTLLNILTLADPTLKTYRFVSTPGESLKASLFFLGELLTLGNNYKLNAIQAKLYSKRQGLKNVSLVARESLIELFLLVTYY